MSDKQTTKRGRPLGSTKKDADIETFKKYTFNLDNGLRSQLELIGSRDSRTLASVVERALMTYIALHDTNGDEVYNIKHIIQKATLEGVPVMPHSSQAKSMAFPEGKPMAVTAMQDTSHTDNNVDFVKESKQTTIEDSTESKQQEEVENVTAETTPPAADPVPPASSPAPRQQRGQRKPVSDI